MRLIVFALIVGLSSSIYAQNWNVKNKNLTWQLIYKSEVQDISALKKCLIERIDSLPEFKINSTHENEILIEFQGLKFYYSKYGFEFNSAPRFFSSGFVEGFMKILINQGRYEVMIYSLSTLLIETVNNAYGNPYVTNLKDRGKKWDNLFLVGDEIKGKKYGNALKIADLNFIDMFEVDCAK